MKKIFWYSDFLRATGFGTVSENIIERLMPDFEFEVLGINHHGNPYNTPNSPYYKFKDIPVYPAMFKGDMLGYPKLLGMLIEKKFDTLFILQDLFNILPIIEEIKSIKKKKGFKWVLYFPVDGCPKKEWLEVISTADVAVAYTNYSNSQLGLNLPVIYHGVDKTFKRVDNLTRKSFRTNFFGLDDDTILVTNVNRNQPRKDLSKTIIAFDLFHARFPNSVLYLHCNWNDECGMKIGSYLAQYFPHLKDKIISPRNELSKENLNLVYNASDMIVSSTLGEGWGLSTVEAMAAETPIILPDNTTAKEIVGVDRGYLVKSGNKPSLWVCNKEDNDIMRPLVDVEDMASQMEYCITNKDETSVRVKNAKAWVTENCDWDKIAEEWKKLL